MTFRFALAPLLAAVLLGPVSPLRAQTPLGQPSLEEAKVQIWCAAVRFVYDDAGRPTLKSTVRCDGGNLEALAASIRPDSLRVYSLLYQPIEGQGKVYQGKKDNPARLAALTKAIVLRLKSSPARRRNPARMARVAALEQALSTYVERGTPLGEVAAAMTPEVPDTAATTAPVLGPAEAAEAQAVTEPDRPIPAAPAPPSTPGAESLLNRFATPLALILGILSLVLYVLLRVSMGRWTREQRRETLAARQAATTAQAAAAETSAAVADSAARVKRAEALVLAAAPEPKATSPAADQLTPAQRLEVERLVSQQVARELQWLQANWSELLGSLALPAAPAAPTPPAAHPTPDTGSRPGPAADDVRQA